MRVNLDDRVDSELRRLDALLPANSVVPTRDPRDRVDPGAVEQAARIAGPATEALAAIASTYEDARAGILSDEPAPSAETEDCAADFIHGMSHPTMPLTLKAGLDRSRPPQEPPAGELPEASSFWSRLVQRREAPRGRHSPRI